MAYRPRADQRGPSSAELQDERRALEAAGREEWERATREGRDVQARTTDELRALGARALAGAAGAQLGTNRWERASGRNGDRVVVTAQEDQADDALERREVQTNVELRPNLNERIDQAAGKRLYMTIEADWDPSRSNGVTAMPTPDLLDAGETYKGLYHVGSGAERLGFLTPYNDGSYFFEPPDSAVKTGSSEDDDYASALAPRDAGAGIHWHRDKGSDGFVDAPTDRRPYGDSSYLRQGKPMATVYDGEVGWHGWTTAG
jgi:hypothetical protein